MPDPALLSASSGVIAVGQHTTAEIAWLQKHSANLVFADFCPRSGSFDSVESDTAEAMRQKAESFKQDNQAAVVEMIVRILPELAGKISEPLSKTERMVIVNSGNGVGGGAPGRR